MALSQCRFFNMKNSSSMLAVVLSVLILSTPAVAKGYGPFPAFGGNELPSTASVFGSIAVGQSGFQPYTLGYFLDQDGDTTAELADVGDAIGAPDGIQTLHGAYVSPSNPAVVYALYSPANGGGLTIAVMRRDGDSWVRIGNPVRYPQALAEYASASWNAVEARKRFPQFQASWTNVVSLRRLRSGSDALLVTAIRLAGGHTQSRFALLVDSSDGDVYADQWSSVEELPDLEAMTLDEQGGVLARHSVIHPGPVDGTDYFVRLVPRTDGTNDIAQTPVTIDEASRVEAGVHGAAASCWGDVDYGTGRFFYGVFMGTINLDSLGAPVPGSLLPFEDLVAGPVPWDSDQVLLDPSGSPFSVSVNPQGQSGVIHWNDLNFDGLVANRFGAPYEAFPVFYENQLPNPYLINASVAKPSQVTLTDDSTTLRFSDFGDYGSGQAFQFRYGGQDYTGVWVSANGIVSFTGPVSGTASSSRLADLHGVIAPAWSDRWDTSEARIYAGYSPVDVSFRDGASVFTFAIEWRGLRDRTWEAGRSFSMRLLLFSDGTFRTDYGAIDEVTGTPFVVGYSGPGTHSTSIDVEPSDHSWGEAPAGTGSERVVSHEYTSTNELGHIQTRWLGYPERLEPPGPTPIVENLKLKRGKLTFDARGSNVEADATLVVDGIETFTLKRNAAGTKWVVGKKARSVPSRISIAAALEGGAHTIVVINPDGSASEVSSWP